MPTSLRLLLVSLLVAVSATAAQDSGSGRSSSGSAPAANSRGDGGNPAANTSSAPASAMTTITDPSYSLNKGDTIHVAIGTRTNPDEAFTTKTISKSGQVRLPWIDDDILLEGKTVRDTERYLENLYKERKLLNRPVVSVQVANYFLREVSVSGAVRSPGMLPFPPDTVSMDIADVIFKVGGFSPIAKATEVLVYHREANGKETTVTLDLDSLRTGRQKAGKGRAEFAIYPGDRIFVQETFF